MDQFRDICKIYYCKNLQELLRPLPVDKQRVAMTSILNEVQARIQDPVHGCSSSILALQQEVCK